MENRGGNRAVLCSPPYVWLSFCSQLKTFHSCLAPDSRSDSSPLAFASPEHRIQHYSNLNQGLEALFSFQLCPGATCLQPELPLQPLPTKLPAWGWEQSCLRFGPVPCAQDAQSQRTIMVPCKSAALKQGHHLSPPGFRTEIAWSGRAGRTQTSLCAPISAPLQGNCTVRSARWREGMPARGTWTGLRGGPGWTS